MKLGIFVDQIFWETGKVVSTDELYALFFKSFASKVDSLTFIGRQAAEEGEGAFVLDEPNIRLLPLPYYRNLYGLARAGPKLWRKIRKKFRADAGKFDIVIICGPHPVGQVLARECSDCNIPFVPLIRENLVDLMSARRQPVSASVAKLLQWDFRRLAEGRTVLTVGMEMARAYEPYCKQVHSHFPCLISQRSFEYFSSLPGKSQPMRLLTVGRLSREKCHETAIVALSELKDRGIKCSLDIAGVGPLEGELRNQVRGLGLEDRVTFHGFVPYGPKLFELYRSASALIVASQTEGFPQVINEALCIGLPVIATKVGGIPAFLDDQETALLIPPSNTEALAAAIERCIHDRHLREKLRANGQQHMASNTLEKNRDRVISILKNELEQTYVNA